MLKTTRNLPRRVLLRIASEVVRITKPLDLYLVSSAKLPRKIEYPPIFIIGAPRTGSTLLYQAITTYFNVSYISNFSAAFYHSLYIGMILDYCLLGKSHHNMFESQYGMTSGLRGPNECGQFWYRWFRQDRHFIASEEFSRRELIGIRNSIHAISKRFRKPMIFKNLNNGQRLQVLKKILPEAIFIFVRRDPVFAAQSILASRQDYYGDKNTWFSVMPRNVKEITKKPYPEQVVNQIYYLEKQITEDLKCFPEKQHITIQYEDFCNDTINELGRIEKFFSANQLCVNKRENVVLPPFRINKRRLVSKDDFQQIQRESAKIAWASGHSESEAT